MAPLITLIGIVFPSLFSPGVDRPVATKPVPNLTRTFQGGVLTRSKFT
jgi:hypothetical protein